MSGAATGAGDDWRALNRANWDERVPVHLGPRGYDLTALRAGRGRLDAVVEAELGPTAGLRVVHLQCHFGEDSLVLAQQGAAEVVGVDFSAPAVEAARALAAELGLADRARFVCCDLYDAPDALGPEAAGRFDLAFATWGTICWLPDVRGWARVAARLLRPGGVLYFADAHPAALVFDDAGEGAPSPGDGEARPGWLVPYLARAPLVFEEATDYADPEARLANRRTVQWLHPLADLLDALREAGLRVEWLREHPRVAWRMFRGLVRDPEDAGGRVGLWTWPGRAWLPLALSLRAVREA